jgi:hypothetical protein
MTALVSRPSWHILHQQESGLNLSHANTLGASESQVWDNNPVRASRARLAPLNIKLRLGEARTMRQGQNYRLAPSASASQATHCCAHAHFCCSCAGRPADQTERSTPRRRRRRREVKGRPLMADRQCKKPSITSAWATPSTCNDFFQYLLSLDGTMVDQEANAITFSCRYTTEDIGRAGGMCQRQRVGWGRQRQRQRQRQRC